MHVACRTRGGTDLGIAQVMHVGLIAAALLTVMAPFEPRTPIVGVAGVVFTLPEVTWLVAAGLWLLSRRQDRQWTWTLMWPCVAWVAVYALAAALAPTHAGNAFRATVRLATLCGTAWMVATTVRSDRDEQRVLLWLLGVGLVVAAGALWEVVAPDAASVWLVFFRESVRLVGGEVRASGPLQYPTITAAILAALVVVAAGLSLTAGGVQTTRGRWLIASVFVLSAALAVTLTRAALGAALVGLMVWARAVWSTERMVRTTCVACVVALCLPTAGLAVTETARLRWSTEGRGGWYQATFEAPPVVSGNAGELITVPVVVRNAGRRTWRSDSQPPFLASYHVVEVASTKVVAFEGERTPFPSSVSPGEAVTLSMTVRMPRQPGRYRLAWDVVQEHRLWFSAERDAEWSFSALEVGGAAVRTPAPPPAGRAPVALVTHAEPAGRLTLWRAAAQLFRESPWIGVGPDNFRLLAGAYLPPGQADVRVLANNMYIETAVGAGVVGMAALLGVIAAGVATARRGVVARTGLDRSRYAGVCGALVACLVHGCLDSFLTFTPTLQVMGVLLGVVTATRGVRP